MGSHQRHQLTMGIAMNKIGYAVTPVGEVDLCFTSAPEILGEGSIYQIYTNRADAERFCAEIEFSDAEYEVVEVTISSENHRG
jgi:hypothetical protein